MRKFACDRNLVEILRTVNESLVRAVRNELFIREVVDTATVAWTLWPIVISDNASDRNTVRVKYFKS